VARWLRNVARGSPLTCEVAAKKLGRLSQLLGTTPSGLLDWAVRGLKGLKDALEDLVARLESEEKSPGYILWLGVLPSRGAIRYIHDVES